MPVYGTLNDKNRNYENNETKRGIPIMSRYTSFWQKYDVAYYCSLIGKLLRGVDLAHEEC